MIVWVASYPRSGNRFFRTLITRFLGLPTYSVYVSADLSAGAPYGPKLDAMAASGDVHFVKTHELPEDHSGSAVYLVRDGRDALVSHAHHVIQFPATNVGQIDLLPTSHPRVLHGLMGGNRRFGGWSGNVEAWRRRKALTVVVRFEELIRNPRETVLATLAALKCDLPCDASAEIPTFEALRLWAPHQYRRGKVGAWKGEMPPGLRALFNRMHGPTMRACGYPCGAEPPGQVGRLLEHNSQPDLAKAEHVERLYTGRVPANGVFVGGGWHTFEAYAGQRFRWAGDNAEIVLTAPDSPRTLKLEVEPGPSCGGRPLEFEVRDARGNTLFAQTVPWRQTLPIPLPRLPKSGTTLRLVSRNGGQRLADGRVLNFRAFAIELVA